jgi:cytochrome c-type biogenesis protein CcmH
VVKDFFRNSKSKTLDGRSSKLRPAASFSRHKHAGMTAILLALLLSATCSIAWAGEAKDLAEDPIVEKRLVALAENLRCLVCQNESLASSHAELAEDLRRQVREMIKKNMSDKEITDYLVARYGDFVLYQPPVKPTTMLLWFGPFLLLLTGAGVLFFQLRKRREQIPDAALSAEAERRAADLLDTKKIT